MPYSRPRRPKQENDSAELTNTWLVSSESFPGYGVLTANAIQLAKIVASIKISKALEVGVKSTAASAETCYNKNTIH